MAEDNSGSGPIKVISAAIVIVVIAAGRKLGWWELKIDEATVTGTLMAGLGLFIAWLVGVFRQHNIEPDRVDEPREEEVRANNNRPNPQWVAAYNNVVARHNRVVESRQKWIEYSDGEHARAEWLRLNSRAFRVALYFSVWSALAALLKPVPIGGNRADIRIAELCQEAILFLGAVVVPVSLVVDAARARAYSAIIVAFRTGFLGMLGCAFINLVISLPYRQDFLLKQIDPVSQYPALYVIVVLRMVVLPAIGFVAAYFASALARRSTAT